MRLSEIGKNVKEEWLRTAIIRPGIQLDSYEILLHDLHVTVTGLRLPNHVHGIIILNEGRGHVAIRYARRGVYRYAPTEYISFALKYDWRNCARIQTGNDKTYQ